MKHVSSLQTLYVRVLNTYTLINHVSIYVNIFFLKKWIIIIIKKIPCNSSSIHFRSASAFLQVCRFETKICPPMCILQPDYCRLGLIFWVFQSGAWAKISLMPAFSQSLSHQDKTIWSSHHEDIGKSKTKTHSKWTECFPCHRNRGYFREIILLLC